jgi:crossover junction endodeoxyribonuclease RuvC
MLVIGIDPGTATTGYGLVQEEDDGSLAVVDYGVVLTTPDLPMPERLLLMYRQLKEILLLHRPESGAVEKLFFARNSRTAISVGQGRGVVLLALAESGVEVAEYTPMEVKQAVAGYGGADKHQIQEMVRMLLGLESIPKPDDAADALAIAICHLQYSHTRALYNGADVSP